MSAAIYVSKNGKVSEAIGVQPKEALLFAPSSQSSAQVLKEQRAALKRNHKHIKERFALATKR